MDIAIMVLDAKAGLFLYVNQHVYDDLRLTEEQVLGKHYHEVFWEDFIQLYEALSAACADGKIHTDIHHWVNRSMWEQISASKILWEPGQQAILLTITNISEVSRSLIEYKQLAYYDTELGLPNRASLEQDVSGINDLGKVGAVRFDILQLTTISDLYGWRAQELLLGQIRDWVLGTIASTAQLYRINENGFCILRRQTTQAELEKRSRQITQRFSQPWFLNLNGEEFQVLCDINVGIIFGQSITSDLNNLLFHTLYKRTRDGECYVLYDQRYDEELRFRLQLRQDLMKCAREGMKGFSVRYQPIVEAKTGRWVGVEALSRFEHPVGGAISPSVFIEEAEQIGLIEKLDDWVYQTAMEQCRDIGLHEKDFHLSVNYSPVQKLDHKFTSRLFHLTDTAHYPKSKLGLEVTESAKMKFDDATLSSLRNLQAGKVILALDDFGMGYSSFENLLRLSANMIKTDRSIIEDIETDANKQYLMQLVVHLADFANMKLIAEGVETKGQLELLQSYGVEFIQGFLFSKPLTADELRVHRSNFELSAMGG